MDSKYLQTNSGASERLFFKMPSKYKKMYLILWKYMLSCIKGFPGLLYYTHMQIKTTLYTCNWWW